MIKKLFFGYLVIVFILVGICYAAWDESKPASTDIVATCITDTRTNFDAINDVFGTDLDAGSISGIRLPSGAIFYMITGSCPTGSTDVTTTYSDKFLRVGSSQGTTGGANTHTHAAGTYAGPSHTHTFTPAWASAAAGREPEELVVGRTGVNPIANAYRPSGNKTTLAGGTGTITGTSASGDNVPAYCYAVLCQVN